VVGTAGGSELDLCWTLLRVEASCPVPSALARQEGLEPRDKLGVWITAAVTLAALILMGFGFLGVAYLFMGEFICDDRSPWWGPPEDPTSECSGLWYAEKHTGAYPWNLPR
jgi:hypothetical protein